jgi:hypothetical protein
LAGAALGAGDEVVDLINEGAEEWLVLGLEGVRESGKSNVSGFSNRNCCLAN